LVGQTCMVTQYDLPCLFQSHILRLRLSERPPFNQFLFLALLNSPTVKLQIRARQFTADIIDTIGNRYREVLLPVPRDEKRRTDIANETRNVVETRSKLREAIRKIPLWAQGVIGGLGKPVPEPLGQMERGQGHSGFLLPYSNVRNLIFVPRYYDPHIDSELQSLAETHQLIPLANLVKQKVVSWSTGIEPGKMAYGTGPVPFIRTSDISNWELKADPKQSVSKELYEQHGVKQDVQAEDIFVVRDGTYLVGTSCFLTEHDTRILYCGGIYKLRVNKKDELDPYLLLALLNTPIVRRQMRAKQFTRDIIDTLGKRLFEVVLPVPKDAKLREAIASETRKTVQTRVRLRNRTREIALEVEGLTSVPEEAKELLESL
jgi:5-formyltetrahydrofolate cyclo-ligase